MRRPPCANGVLPVILRRFAASRSRRSICDLVGCLATQLECLIAKRNNILNLITESMEERNKGYLFFVIIQNPQNHPLFKNNFNKFHSFYCLYADGAPGEYYAQGYYDFFPGHQPPPDHQGEPLAYMGTPVSQHNPLTSLEQPLHQNMSGLPPEGAQQFGIPHKDLSPSPEPPMSMTHNGDGYRHDGRFIMTRAGLPHGGPLNGYGRGMTQELVGEVW